MNQMMDDFVHSSASLFDQNFGLVLRPSIKHPPWVSQSPLRSGYLRPWRHVPFEESGFSNVTSNKDEFKVNLDVQQFKPDEIDVKLKSNFLVVKGKHEECHDNHGFISRQFQRRYQLPDNVDADKIIARLSTDGVLTLRAKTIQEVAGERKIPIEATNKPVNVVADKIKSSSKIQEVAGERTIPIEATNKPSLETTQSHSNSNQEKMES